MIDQYKLVPVEPTPEMLKAADCVIDCDPIWMARAYRAMLAAAPEAPQLTIPPGYKLVPIKQLTANTSGVRIWS